MKKLLRRVLVVLVVVAVLFGVASTIHLFRERALRSWAEGLGGTCESGGLLGYVDVPEAAPFDPGHPDVTVRYHAVVRVARGDERYVLALCDRSYRRAKEDPADHVVVLAGVPLRPPGPRRHGPVPGGGLPGEAALPGDAGSRAAGGGRLAEEVRLTGERGLPQRVNSSLAASARSQ